jgi:hypothetical protein
MNLLKMAVRQTVSFFIDDEFLALATLAVIGVTAIVVKATTNILAAEFTLLGGSLAVLVVGVCRSARTPNRE